MEGAIADTPSGPPRGLDRLLELQELDLAIDRMGARIRALEGGEELGSVRESMRDAEGRVGELRLSLDEVATHQRHLEGDVDGVGRKMEGERTRLYDGSVANVKELQSIEHEVESLRARRSRMEDDVLELMERREELETQIASLEVEVAQARAAVQTVEEGSARELVELERELAERVQRRAALVPLIDEELLALYEDIRRQKRGVGAAALVDGVCQGCHQKLSPVFLDRLRRVPGIWRCEYCRRILVAR